MDAKFAATMGLRVPSANANISIASHVLESVPTDTASQFLSASRLPEGSLNHNGTPLRISLDKFRAAGGKVIENPEILANLEKAAGNGMASPFQVRQWLNQQPRELEILLKGDVPPSAITTPAMATLKCAGKCVAVIAVLATTVELGTAANQSINEGSSRPLTAGVIRSGSTWACVWIGAKSGAVIGASAGIETGPGAILTGIAGAIFGGLGGLACGDYVADKIHEN
jgi:hypothetical protein